MQFTFMMLDFLNSSEADLTRLSIDGITMTYLTCQYLRPTCGRTLLENDFAFTR